MEFLNPRNGNQPRPKVEIALLPLTVCDKKEACKNVRCIMKGGDNVPIMDVKFTLDKVLEISCYGY